MYLRRIEVDDLWGRLRIATDVRDDVNIFVGTNGTGKTTLMNLIHGVLCADVDMLASISFSCATLTMGDGDHTRKVVVTRETGAGRQSGDGCILTYRLWRDKQVVYADPGRKGHGPWTRHPAYIRRAREIEVLRQRLSEYAKVRWLSVHRHTVLDADQEEQPTDLPAVDVKLRSLLRELASYQFTLESREAQASLKFQREVISTILYDKELDSFHPERLQEKSVGLDKQREDLERAFSELGFAESDFKQRIDDHIARIAKSIQAFTRLWSNPQQAPEFTLNDALPLPLLHRTERIVALLRKVELEKKRIFEYRNLFLNHVNSFLAGKQIEMTAGGDLQALVGCKRSPVNLFDLSSGEKQLLIQLIDALVQDNSPCVFIADEPEISLHVEWQERLLECIKSLNPQAQVIVATHSPDIIADYNHAVINMEEVSCASAQ